MSTAPDHAREGSDRRLLAVLGGFLVGWAALTQLAGPLTIAAAYRGHSLPFLNAQLEGRLQHPLTHYLNVFHDSVSFPLLALGLGAWLIVWVLTRPAFFRRCVGPATPGALGAIRSWVCAILLVNVLQEDLSTISWLPVGLRRPMGVMSLLHAFPTGLDWLVRSAAGLRVFQGVTAAILLLGLLGWGTGLVVPLGAILSLTLFGILREYSFFWHQNLVALYVLTVLACTPCGDGWSVDRLRRLAQGRAVPPGDRPTAAYGWCRYACWVALAMPYLAAGFSKLRNVGWLWWAPQNMRRFLYGDTLNPVHFDWNLSLHLAGAPDAVFAFLGIAGVWGEALFALVLVSRLARRVLPALMASMHVGIMFLQNILFLDLILLQAIFYDFTRWDPLESTCRHASLSIL